MAGDALKKVHVGEDLAIPAGAYNAFIDAARAEQARQGDRSAGPGTAPRESGIVLIKNTTESDLERFAILGLDGPIFTPTDNEQEFKNRVALVGVAPDVDEHCGRFAVLLEPLAASRIGLGMVQGVTPVRLRTYTDHSRSADVQDSKTGYLCDQIAGAAKILWREEGVSEDEEDLKWAVVALRGGGAAGASYVWRAQVTGVYAADGGAWVSYAADGWQAYVTAHPLYQNGTPDEETTLLLKLTADCGGAEAGYKEVAGGDKVGYIIATDTSDVPGQPAGTGYDGWVILHGGDDGATLAALQHAAGGPGIDVDELVDPFKPKVKVDLAPIPGLEFDVGGDAGKLRALPDRGRGLDLDAAGIFIDLADANPGLVFEAPPSGDLKVLPNPNKAIVVEALGVGVKIDTERALVMDANKGIQVKVDTNYALEINAADGIRVKIDANGPVIINDSHDLDLDVGHYAALVIGGASGTELQVAVDVASGLKIGAETDKGLQINLHSTYPGLEFDSNQVRQTTPSDCGSGAHFSSVGGITDIYADRYGRVYCAF